MRAAAKQSQGDRHALQARDDDESFLKQKDVLEYIREQIQGGEAILFKGSQSLLLEGIIEPLLKDKEDADKLQDADRDGRQEMLRC